MRELFSQSQSDLPKGPKISASHLSQDSPLGLSEIEFVTAALKRLVALGLEKRRNLERVIFVK